MATTVFLTTTGGATWTKDSTWNDADNDVHGIGAGGNGGNGYQGGTIFVFQLGASGGGGGAYATKADITLAGNPSYTIGAGGSLTDTNFHSGQVIAKAGTNGVTTTVGVGGAAASCTPSTGAFSGGNGGANGVGASGSGGGSGGPSGAGANGTGSGGAGGSANGGTPAGGAPNTAGTAGTFWSGTHGPGSGAGGRTSGPANGLAGGLYGGAGSGGVNNGVGGGSGAQGLIVLIWTPAAGAKYVQIYIMG
jgi:hypothetical protein